jgi:hypothetical protein
MGILGNISPNYPWVALPGGITAMVYVGYTGEIPYHNVE